MSHLPPSTPTWYFLDHTLDQITPTDFTSSLCTEYTIHTGPCRRALSDVQLLTLALLALMSSRQPSNLNLP